MIRANIGEDKEATMARFLARSNHDIWDVVEFQHYGAKGLGTLGYEVQEAMAKEEQP